MSNLRLQTDELDLVISPSNGGGIISFDAFGTPVLKQAPDVIAAPSDPAAFVLLPYCNRIAQGRARVGDEFLHLTPAIAGEAHALHGEGWIAEWTVEEQTDRSAILSLCHLPEPGHWPWAFDASQHYELAGMRMVHTVCLKNTSDRSMPAGLGFHPYFPRSAADLFTAHVAGKWNVSDDLLPTRHEACSSQDYWSQQHLPDDVTLDNCFTGWDGKFTIARKDLLIRVIASEALKFLHIYAPRGADFFCAEPVSHMPDALNRAGAPGQMQTLLPGETLEASATYLVEKAS